MAETPLSRKENTMDRTFHQENRAELYRKLPSHTALVLFSGKPIRKTGDEDYLFFADRSFVYYTGIEQQESVLLAVKGEETTQETLFMLPPDPMAERWTGIRLKPQEATDRSGVHRVEPVEGFLPTLRKLLTQGIDTLYLDFDKLSEEEQPVRQAYFLADYLRKEFPYVTKKDIHSQIRIQRTIKKPCELEAMRKAQTITKEGILAMMRASKDGMYEYQYKAEFDYALAQRGVLSPGFPSIISAGKNNFQIHYHSYRGQAHDGDLVLNDVGACWDNEINDVSRSWPVNGKFSPRQKLLYECAYATSNHMFDILKPGYKMSFVDQEIRRYNFERLRDAGVLERFEDIGTYMWHGGAHHVGYDVHDVVDTQGGEILIQPGMVFCIDVGIYHEEWGIGFRLEDNCLITEDGCENLSRVTPRSIEDIEAFMN
jgi:Xaa-Pro aminopeptidase